MLLTKLEHPALVHGYDLCMPVCNGPAAAISMTTAAGWSLTAAIAVLTGTRAPALIGTTEPTGPYGSDIRRLARPATQLIDRRICISVFTPGRSPVIWRCSLWT
jgi:hypothetical protein